MTDMYEVQTIGALIAKGRGWQSISEATGRSVDYLRGVYGAIKEAPAAAPKPAPPRPPMPVIAAFVKSDCPLEKALSEVSSRTGVSKEDILSPSRDRPINHARQEVMHLLRQQGFTTPAIGELMNRDHTSVLHSLKAYASRVSGDQTFFEQRRAKDKERYRRRQGAA